MGFHALPSLFRQAVSQGRLIQKGSQCSGQRRGIVSLGQKSALGKGDDLWEGPGPRCDDGCSAGHGLNGRESEAFVPGGNDYSRCSAVKMDQLAGFNTSRDPDAGGDARVLSPLEDFVPRVVVVDQC